MYCPSVRSLCACIYLHVVIYLHVDIALSQILETIVTFHFRGGNVYSMNKGMSYLYD